MTEAAENGIDGGMDGCMYEWMDGAAMDGGRVFGYLGPGDGTIHKHSSGPREGFSAL